MMPSFWRHAGHGILPLLALAASFVACGREGESSTVEATSIPDAPPSVAAPISPSPASLSEEARVYLEEALDYIEQNALYRDRVDWSAARAEALRLAAGAETPEGTYVAIRATLSRLGDGHSFLRYPSQAQQTAQGTGSGTPTGRPLDESIGYLALPPAVGPAPGYADTAQQLIREIDQPPRCGWVVDLRDNTGGNMWPMLAGVGPILGEGEVGGFDDGQGYRYPWSYRDGASYSASTELARASDPYRLARPDPPVAVITNRRTASSGEAVVVAFRGRPGTRFFGEGTRGVPTANAGKQLSDGAVILLTVSRMADRAGQAYEASIEPDERFSAAEMNTDAPLTTAIAWLRARPACAQIAPSHAPASSIRAA